MNLLLVENDTRIVEFLQRGLKPRGYAVDVASDGREALAKGAAAGYRLIVLDLRLPLLSGTQVCRHLRRQGVDTPILMLTAMDSPQDIVKGLRAGADDYLTKPFSFAVLVARLEALMRRSPVPGDAVEELRAGDLTLNRATREVYRGGRRIELTPKEFAVLDRLLGACGEVVSKEQLQERVWGYTTDPLTNIVAVFMSHLRRKIDGGAEHKLLRTVRGFGYVLAEPRDADR